MQALRLTAHSRGMHVAQHSSQVSVDVLDLFQSRAPEHELDKRILYQVLCRFMVLVSQAQGPREQTFVTLGEQLLASLFWSCRRTALIQHSCFWAFWISPVRAFGLEPVFVLNRFETV